ncbi:sigma-70 family RNA polymerase sigma factor [Clostridium tyrobutyricum]|jgi:RNA polymerase sigma factor (sigma-70 family)|uniref:sigma-70 family RNA polymerase sigma factor n=1 Tax=Clostridium tyrobutyricum TaxID=1519 RepID=UPI0011CC9020|nr:sigma-70 family RNA polymerase sigma factor [Clostridium tyrobutyricum]MBV4438654.1 sigma-70 family RNA polymerase sigma factor [Clostridium tyrobutyricum]
MANICTLENSENKVLTDLLTKNIKYIYWIAHKYKGSVNDFEDLVSAGKIGFIKAYKNYNDKNSSDFLAYAYSYIKGEILSLSNKNNFYINISNAQLRKYLKFLKNNSKSIEKYSSYRYENVINLDGLLNIKDPYSDSDLNNIEDSLDRKYFIKKLLKSANLSKIELFVLDKFYYKQMSLYEISILLDMKKSRIEDIKKRAIRKLRAASTINDIRNSSDITL